MHSSTYTLELLTPCFCAGADQAKAEIRAPAIRGQLRWWFRALGGSASDERSIFGGTASTVSASSLIIRVQGLDPKPWAPPAFSKNDPESYVWYFASVSGTTVEGAKGPRWQAQGAYGPGTKFQIHILQRRLLITALQAQLDRAIDCFLRFGAIGLRATRGLGAFYCEEKPFSPAALEALKPHSFLVEHRKAPLSRVADIVREIGGLVKGSREGSDMKVKNGGSPFGSSSPRQTSAVYFRPVRTHSDSNECSLVIFEAPHERILGAASRKPSVVGRDPSRIVKPVPRPPRR